MLYNKKPRTTHVHEQYGVVRSIVPLKLFSNDVHDFDGGVASLRYINFNVDGIDTRRPHVFPAYLVENAI
jgi:hypothetical protein